VRKKYRTRKTKKNKPRKISDDVSVEEVAAELAAYITDRAAVEGVESVLDAEFFTRHLRDGVVGFFGVDTDFNGNGELKMTRDLQEPFPGSLDTWMKQAQDDGLDDVCIECREAEKASNLH